MLVLVTGAAGTIGSRFLAEHEGGPFELRPTDLRPGAPGAGGAVGGLDVTDPGACRQACRGADAVLHLAADPSPSADFRTSVLPTNMIGTYNLVEAAVGTGVGRVVFASSIHAVGGYPRDRQVREGDPPLPSNDYGVGKAFGEALCASLAARSATTFVSVRIGNYGEHPPPAGRPLGDRAAWVSPRDLMALLRLALTAHVDGHLVAHGSSDNAVKRLAIDDTCRALGYAPRDDAFASDGEGRPRDRTTRSDPAPGGG